MMSIEWAIITVIPIKNASLFHVRDEHLVNLSRSPDIAKQQNTLPYFLSILVV